MAVKKANKTEEVKVETPVVETPVEEQVENVEVDKTEEVTTETGDTPEVEIPEVEVEEPKADEPEVEVDKTEVDTDNKPDGKVKVRMRTDHKCCIAMERYDLKAGKTYVVPENVKRILNNAGLLAPL